MRFFKPPCWDNRKTENQNNYFIHFEKKQIIQTTWELHNPNLTKSVISLWKIKIFLIGKKINI